MNVMETKKVLIVDDDIDVINIVEAILKKEGFEVLSANDKKQGLKLIKSWKPDLAILDVMMNTQFEGFELAKEIMDNPDLKGMPVIMQSSIDALVTTKPSVQQMAREFRNDPNYKDLDVLLLKNIETGDAGVDYRNEDGDNIFFPVNAFIRKPVHAEVLIPEIKRFFNN